MVYGYTGIQNFFLSKMAHFSWLVDSKQVYASFFATLFQVFRLFKDILMVYGYTGIKSFFLSEMAQYSIASTSPC